MRKSWRIVFGGAAGLLLTAGIVLLYVWAEPHPSAMRFPFAGKSNAAYTMRMENMAFTNFVNGHKSWSVNAKRLDVERDPFGAFSSIHNATLAGISNGALYSAAPDNRPQHVSFSSRDSSLHPEQPVARFRADQGRFTLNPTEAPSADISLNDRVIWQFTLSHNVVFTTRDGDQFKTDAMTIAQVTAQTGGNEHQRIVCDSGATIQHQGVIVQANQVRFSPQDRQVECLGGVRVRSKLDTLQAERLFWSFADQTLRCPEAATGVVRGAPFTATNVTIDTRRHQISANHVQGELRMENTSLSSAP